VTPYRKGVRTVRATAICPRVSPRFLRIGLSIVLALLCLPSFPLALGEHAEAVPILDPPGDAAPSAGSFFDIESVDLVSDGVNLTFTLTVFPGPATPPLPPSSGDPLALAGAVEFHVDQDAATGDVAYQDLLRPSIGHPPSGLGVEFAADLFSEAVNPGFIDIVAPTIGGLVVGTIPITYMPLGLTCTVPLALLGGDDGVLSYGVIIGDVVGPIDAAPGTQVVPEPSTIWLLGLGLASWLGFRGWRRLSHCR
jgi:hypothetical protein